MLKNKLFAVLIVLSLSMPVMAVEESDGITSQINDVNEITEVAESAQETMQTDETVMPELKEEQLPPVTYKQPNGKRKTVKKFLFAMFGVGISSLIIFIGLSIYNRLRTVFLSENSNVVNHSGIYRESSLEVPSNMEDAVRSFVEQTKWDE